MTNISEMSIPAIAVVLDELKILDQQISNSLGDWFVVGTVRVWHQDEWSPGYFKYEDDAWNFYADYQEVP